MKENAVQIKMTTRQTVLAELTAEEHRTLIEASDGSGEELIELVLEGSLSVEGNRVTVRYEETELTGMEGSTTTLSFDRTAPGLVTMMREGAVRTVLVFEQGRQHICTYHTPFMPFEISVRTYRVVNELLENGFVYLDYSLEIRGARLERNKFTMEITPRDERLHALLTPDPLPDLPSAGENA